MILAVTAIAGLQEFMGTAMVVICRYDAFDFAQRIGERAAAAIARRALARFGLSAFAAPLARSFFEGGTCELVEALRGLRTRVSD